MTTKLYLLEWKQRIEYMFITTKGWKKRLKLFYLTHYGLNQAQAARVLNISRERARQLLNSTEPYRAVLVLFCEGKKMKEMLDLLNNFITLNSLVKRLKNSK